ncbi:MAG: DNA polymerase III subunit gamma/tau, partial [Planctomycetota bacterium]|nr:DNA polymerase III subunit gamma/tau [Planctomycetota bacterium]
MNSTPASPDVDNSGSDAAYQVVARRYRPQSFESLVGQSQISTALTNAIKTDRVGHAYLFTGARGVGKTSAARIFAKCLNCDLGPIATPCGNCEVCSAVNDGEDVDVLEIDGASNRGIDEIRELRANINVRPSRSRYKIYIIDEVHMLTMQAFNALLKTLEEPPTHVKFIFCTTDPEKIPITVLSRCQRFDFAPVEADSISNRLAEICKSEGFEADPEALALIARRANGSMRDSQSLLEQLLSFCQQRISLADVNQMFGTADLGRVKSIVCEIVNKNSKAALEEFDESLNSGVNPGQLGSQIVGFLRDMLVAQNGCDQDLLLTGNPCDFEQILELGNRLGGSTLLASLQVFDECLTRLRSSSHPRTLIEMAIIRTCHLENLEMVSSLIRQAKSGLELVISENPNGSAQPFANDKPDTPPRQHPPTSTPAAVDSKKKQANPVSPSPPGENLPRVNSKNRPGVDSNNVEALWQQTLEKIEDFIAEYARHYQSIAISAPNCLA